MFKRKSVTELQEQLAGLKGGFQSEDKNEWKLKTDAAGNGNAVIRFLPAKDDNATPFVKLTNHGFKKNGKWYINNCSSTHGDYESCPVCKYLSEKDSYNTNPEEYKLIKRKHSYWANILVVKDPNSPENEGKVFKYRFGQKIMDKIDAMANVDIEMGETPVNIFCPFEGANFALKVKKVSGFPNYDDCKFYAQSEIPNIDDEAVQKSIIDQCVDLQTIVAKDQFKPYAELETKFKQVMGVSMVAGSASSASADIDAELDNLSAQDDFSKQMNAFNDSVDLGESVSTSDQSVDDILNDLI
ncbi:single-stranded DNA-binding protein [Proteus phage PM2]|uniref:Single-stranded DNA-binding protein n=1 Tax=Proteus phage PM2 TaxID=2025809 RepID=A0A249XX09_9CAUD|nr:single strand DNA binding protein [Proteus phage PM2]ASZ76497.1 single-stranded DNA-binding protein [Proteus phage PM2]